jgi:oligopeptide transport system permease protein
MGKEYETIYAQLSGRGYFDPIPVQFFNYLKRIFLYGDLGICYNLPGYRNSPIWDVFVEKLPPTILINVYSSLVAVPIGIALGIFAALKKNKWQDHVISTTVMVFISVPSFVYAFLVQFLLCFVLDLLPLTMKPGYDYFSWEMFKSMIPAVISMSFGSIAGYARFTRAELTEVLTSEYMLLARTKGLTKAQATTRHALRNAMVPIFPSIVGEFISVLSGSLIIEKIFSIPGVGGLYLDAITHKDYDSFMMLSGFYVLIGLAAAIVIDLSYGIIDPRIRMGAK